MKDVPLLECEYQIPISIFDKAFRLFQKKHVYPRNIGISIILLIVIVIYVQAAFEDPSNALTYLLIFTCLAAMAIQWYNPRKIRRNLLFSLKELEDDRYVLKLYPNQISVGTILPEETLPPETDPEPVSQEPEKKNGFRDIFEAEAELKKPVAESLLPFQTITSILEKPEFFMVNQKKAMFYVIPKAGLSDADLQILSSTFQTAMGSKFKPIAK